MQTKFLENDEERKNIEPGKEDLCLIITHNRVSYGLVVIFDKDWNPVGARHWSDSDKFCPFCGAAGCNHKDEKTASGYMSTIDMRNLNEVTDFVWQKHEDNYNWWLLTNGAKTTFAAWAKRFLPYMDLKKMKGVK